MTFPDEKYYDDLVARLGDLKQQFARHVFDGVRLKPGDCSALIEELEDLRNEADRMTRELSATRWNDRAAADPVVDAVLEAAAQPNSNIVFFPVIGRPIPNDAIQKLDGGDGAA